MMLVVKVHFDEKMSLTSKKYCWQINDEHFEKISKPEKKCAVIINLFRYISTSTNFQEPLSLFISN